MANKLIIEVGVNTGQDTQSLLDKYPDAKYYGFEPTLDLYLDLMNRFHDGADADRVNFLPMAVSKYCGFSHFNIAGASGCSSLNHFTPDIEQKWYNPWGHFRVVGGYRVPVITLESFLMSYLDEEAEIEYLWIDAQGSDLDVLEGLGGGIEWVKAGRLETAYTVDLYQNTGNTLQNAEAFLTAHGFAYTVTPDDVGKECNIEFWRL